MCSPPPRAAAGSAAAPRHASARPALSTRRFAIGPPPLFARRQGCSTAVEADLPRAPVLEPLGVDGTARWICDPRPSARTVHDVALPYPPFQLEVTTPRLQLLGATDERLEQLIPVVRDGVVRSDELPFDDPMSFYEPSPTRERRWMRAIWSGR